jgi:hypothetical protein
VKMTAMEKLLKDRKLKSPGDDFRQNLKYRLKHELQTEKPAGAAGLNFAFVNACLALAIMIMVNIQFFFPVEISTDLSAFDGTYVADSRVEPDIKEELSGTFDSREIEIFLLRSKIEPESEPINQNELIREFLEEVSV